MKRGERSPEATKRYKQLQRHKKRYMELREELQLAGVIPVEPDGAIRDERVDPDEQGEQSLPALTGEAIRRGWAVPEERKPRLVDELVGILDDPEESAKVKVAAFNALRQADQAQYERDNPGSKGELPSAININVVTVEGGPGGLAATEPHQIEVEVVGGDRDQDG